MSSSKHVLGISGGKDSAALAIYLHEQYPQLPIDYYFCDTGKELDETYALIEKLENHLGKKITRLLAKEAEQSKPDDPFDVFLKIYRGYLPSSQARWCTRKLKLDPFEAYVGNTPTISYVGIRADEEREGYISKKSNIQSIFPFRKNIWSEDVIHKVLKNDNVSFLTDAYALLFKGRKMDRVTSILSEPLSYKYSLSTKLNDLLNLGIVEFNKVVFSFLKTTDYPLSVESDFPLLENDEELKRENIFKILEDSIGVPAYYKELSFEVNDKRGVYARSRSGCYFCFFQQKIEWVWLYEQHPEKFQLAMEYEKNGYTWMQDERLEELIKPERINQIKEEQLKRNHKAANQKSPYLIDILEEEEGIGCAACFV